MPKLPTFNRSATIEASVPGVATEAPAIGQARALQDLGGALQSSSSAFEQISLRLKKIEDDEYVFNKKEELDRKASDNLDALKRESPDGFGVAEKQKEFVNNLYDEILKDAPSKSAKRDFLFSSKPIVSRSTKTAEIFERSGRINSVAKTVDQTTNSLRNEITLKPDQNRLINGTLSTIEFVNKQVQNGAIDLVTAEQSIKSTVNGNLKTYIDSKLSLAESQSDPRVSREIANSIIQELGQAIELRADELAVPISIETARELKFSEEAIKSYPKDEAGNLLVGTKEGINIPKPENPTLALLLRDADSRVIAGGIEAAKRQIKTTLKHDLSDLKTEYSETMSALTRNEVPPTFNSTVARIQSNPHIPKPAKAEMLSDLFMTKKAVESTRGAEFMPESEIVKNIADTKTSFDEIREEVRSATGSEVPKELFGKQSSEKLKDAMAESLAKIVSQREADPATFYESRVQALNDLSNQVFVPDERTGGSTLAFDPVAFTQLAKLQNKIQDGAGISNKRLFSEAVRSSGVKFIETSPPDQVAQFMGFIMETNPTSGAHLIGEFTNPFKIEGKALGPVADAKYSIVPFFSSNPETQKKAITLIRSDIPKNNEVKGEIEANDDLRQFNQIINNLPSGSNDGIRLATSVNDLISKRASEMIEKNKDLDASTAVEAAYNEFINESLELQDFSSEKSDNRSRFYTPAVIGIPKKGAVSLKSGIAKSNIEEFVAGISLPQVIEAMAIPPTEEFKRDSRLDGLSEQEIQSEWNRQLSQTIDVRNIDASLTSLMFTKDGVPLQRDGKVIQVSLRDIVEGKTDIQSFIRDERKASEIRFKDAVNKVREQNILNVNPQIGM